MRTAVIAVLLFGRIAEACSCAGLGDTCRSLASSKVVFVGRVIQGTEADNAPFPRRGFGSRSAILSVETVVGGLPDGVREISVNSMHGTSCYFELEPGERWLIFGWVDPRESGLVRTGACSTSRRIPPGDTETDRRVATYLGAPNLFFGNARQYKGWNSRWRTDNLMAGVDVKLVGKQKEWSARTSESGKFEAIGLPPGEYQLQVRRDGFSAVIDGGNFREQDKPPDKIVIPERGCVEAPILMWPDAGISGVVRGVDGNPIVGAKIEAYQLDDQGRMSLRAARSTTSDEQGRYTLPRLGDGSYLVGINGEARSDVEYPTALHPSASNRATAIPVIIAGRKSIEGVDILVVEKRKPITIHVRVLGADGRPVVKALIRLDRRAADPIYQLDSINPSAGVTNTEGLATLRLFEGGTYSISASWQGLDPEGEPLASGFTDFNHVIASPGDTFTVTLKEAKKFIRR